MSNLNAAQLVVLKADILADPALNSQPQNEDGAFAIAAVYNTIVIPDFFVFRTKVSKSDIVNMVSPTGTTFSWSGAGGFIARSIQEQTAWQEIFNSDEQVNPSLANVRQAFLDIFSGAGAAAVANKTHLAAMSWRKATRVEKLFATGTGTTVSPALMAFEGPLSLQDVLLARSLP